MAGAGAGTRIRSEVGAGGDGGGAGLVLKQQQDCKRLVGTGGEVKPGQPCWVGAYLLGPKT